MQVGGLAHSADHSPIFCEPCALPAESFDQCCKDQRCKPKVGSQSPDIAALAAGWDAIQSVQTNHLFCNPREPCQNKSIGRLNDGQLRMFEKFFADKDVEYANSIRELCNQRLSATRPMII